MNPISQYAKSTVGRKTLVAITGVMMIGFLVAHVVGNLQMYEGRGLTPDTTKMNEYSALLHREMALLWVARLGLIATAVVHIVCTISLAIQNKAARPQGYVMKKTYSTAASRMMVFGGLFILCYIVYHLLHFTLGAVHKDLYHPHDVYQNVIDSFQNPAISAVYIAAMIALYFHLYHGTVALFETLGMTNPLHIQWIKKLGFILSVGICAGFISIPVGVYMGWIQ